MSVPNTRIQMRRDSFENWTRVNPEILEGEMTYCSPSEQYPEGFLKVGDGIRRWNDLGIIPIQSLPVSAPM